MSGKIRTVPPLKGTAQLWEDTFDAIPDLIAIVDSSHRITRINRALAERLQRKAEDLVGQPCCTALQGVSANPDLCFSRYCGAGAALILTDQDDAPLGDGYQLTITPLYDANGEAAGSVHAFRDLAPLREAEAARLREELTRMDREPLLGLLSVALAHELNQPLTAMRCNAKAALELIRRQATKDDVSLMITDLLADVMTANQRAASIIANMRAIFEGQPPPADNVLPSAIIREVFGLLRSEADRLSIAAQRGGRQSGTFRVSRLTFGGGRAILTHMKTTIDIADHIMEESRAVARARRLTFRELVEQGLLLALEQQRAEMSSAVTPVTVKGNGLSPAFREASWSRIRDAAYEGHGA